MPPNIPRPPFDPEPEAVLTELADQIPPTLTAITTRNRRIARSLDTAPTAGNGR
ncbi:hypothetical protein [Sciscionella sediminilitoris]|uniref:hypothetical protein n=1 Tax=Sciscionella sediminilitoris TaxID=1445613 RepID=UPI0012E18F6E|nr:hypothetical protein [Sciscionella sp. SE31]